MENFGPWPMNPFTAGTMTALPSFGASVARSSLSRCLNRAAMVHLVPAKLVRACAYLSGPGVSSSRRRRVFPPKLQRLAPLFVGLKSLYLDSSYLPGPNTRGRGRAEGERSGQWTSELPSHLPVVLLVVPSASCLSRCCLSPPPPSRVCVLAWCPDEVSLVHGWRRLRRRLRLLGHSRAEEGRDGGGRNERLAD